MSMHHDITMFVHLFPIPSPPPSLLYLMHVCTHNCMQYMGLGTRLASLSEDGIPSIIHIYTIQHKPRAKCIILSVPESRVHCQNPSW